MEAEPSAGGTMRILVVEDILFSVSLLHRERHITAETEGMEGLVFMGDAHDLEEMLGNLVDNAFKWAHIRVRLHGRVDNGRLVIMVEDDGPGISEDGIEEVLKRGRRLDETLPGSGLGLSITHDLAELYNRGSLELGRLDMGGLAVRLHLPGGFI